MPAGGRRFPRRYPAVISAVRAVRSSVGVSGLLSCFMISIAVLAPVISISGIWIHVHILPSAFIVSNNQFDHNDEVTKNTVISLCLTIHEYVGSDNYSCAGSIPRHGRQASL